MLGTVWVPAEEAVGDGCSQLNPVQSVISKSGPRPSWTPESPRLQFGGATRSSMAPGREGAVAALSCVCVVSWPHLVGWPPW